MQVPYKESTKYIVENHYGISAITRPEDHTVLFLNKKIEDKIVKLYDCKDCFLFFQTGIGIPADLLDRHIFCEVDDAMEAFSLLVSNIYGEKIAEDRRRRYSDRNGSFIGENVVIGSGTYIEPGCLIDHDVVIGDDCVIKYGSVLRHCRIGNKCTVYEHVMIGNEPFNYHKEKGRAVRTIAVGDVRIADNVDIGAHCVIDRGTTTHTMIGEDTKIDGNVRIAHDAILYDNVEVTSWSLIGAFSEVGENAAVFSADVMKRVIIGRNSVVGFDSAVIKNVPDNVEVFGYPARIIKK